MSETVEVDAEVVEEETPSRTLRISRKALQYSGLALFGIVAAGAVILNLRSAKDDEDDEDDSSDD